MFHSISPFLSSFNLPPGRIMAVMEAGCGEKFWYALQVIPHSTWHMPHAGSGNVLSSTWNNISRYSRQSVAQNRKLDRIGSSHFVPDKNKAWARRGKLTIESNLGTWSPTACHLLHYSYEKYNFHLYFIHCFFFALKHWDVLVWFWQGYLTERQRMRGSEGEYYYFHLCYWSELKKSS